jgi:hypothetical protein
LIDHLILGERLGRILGKVAGDVIARVEGLEALEEAELAHHILR